MKALNDIGVSTRFLEFGDRDCDLDVLHLFGSSYVLLAPAAQDAFEPREVVARLLNAVKDVERRAILASKLARLFEQVSQIPAICCQ